MGTPVDEAKLRESKAPIEDLFAEVERIANDRVLDIIQTLIMRRPYCRRLIALREYVTYKLELHRQKKRDRYDSVINVGATSVWCLRQITKGKRIDYYSTDCDCGDCKIKDRPSVFTIPRAFFPSTSMAKELQEGPLIPWNKNSQFKNRQFNRDPYCGEGARCRGYSKALPSVPRLPGCGDS